MKVLFYRYGSICEPDILHTLNELGHSTTQITEEIYNKNLSWGNSARLVSQVLLSQAHDCVFTINFFPAISDVCNIFKIPYISWIVDSPVMELFTKSIQNPCNRVFCFDKAQYLDIAHLNPGHIFHYPLAVNVQDKQTVIQQATPALRNHFQSDVSFVGSLYTEKCPYDKIKNLTPYSEGYLNGIMAAQEKVYGYYFIDELLTDDIILEFKKNLEGYYKSPFQNFLTDKITISQLYVGNKISALERVHVMETLSKHFPIDLYTGSDTSGLPKVHNRGFAKTLTEMPIIFHESKINLNITSKAIRSGIPLRVFDIMACEGFVLSNYQPELAEFFEAGADFDYYSNQDELLEKTDYYLRHTNARKEIAHNAFEKISTEYNYLKRFDELLQIAFS
ncbi:MAG: glycosyltransferase [Roseburia sp.]|nr:glycosyltransferase [Roseburia sp.]